MKRPVDRKVIGVKGVFKTKLNVDDSLNKHKDRLVVKEYAQVFGVHFLTQLPLLPSLKQLGCYWQLLHKTAGWCTS